MFSGLKIHSCAVFDFFFLNKQLRVSLKKMEEIGFDSVFHSFISEITSPLIPHHRQVMKMDEGKGLR